MAGFCSARARKRAPPPYYGGARTQQQVVNSAPRAILILLSAGCFGWDFVGRRTTLALCAVCGSEEECCFLHSILIVK